MWVPALSKGAIPVAMKQLVTADIYGIFFSTIFEKSP